MACIIAAIEMNMLLRHLLNPKLIVLVFLILFKIPAQANDSDIDTTRVREVKKIKKSAGQLVADIPGEILKFPFRFIQTTAKIVSSNPPISYATSVINLSGQAKSYVPVVGYSSRAGLKLGVGLRKLEKLFPGDNLNFKWYYSTNSYQSYWFRYKAIIHAMKQNH